jgi:hypothetical protein
MRFGEFTGHVARGFADHLDEVRQRESKVLVKVERCARRPVVLSTAFLAMSSIWPM